jgi:murein DD-endopeptidase MepM/ murein hydrolase activator NlpD
MIAARKFWLFGTMRIDYSGAEKAHRPMTRRSFLLGTLLAITVGALVTRESVGTERANVFAPGSAAAALAQPSVDDLLQQTAPAPAPSPSEWVTVKVRNGHSLSNIFEDQKLPAEDWIEIVKLGRDAANLRKLKSGDQLQLRIAEGRLQELLYSTDPSETLQIRRNGDSLEAITLTAQIEHRTAYARGTVDSSFFAAGQAAGLSNRLVLQVAGIFAYDIDFALDLREGDRFAVAYETFWSNGKKLRDGDVLAAEFVSQDNSYRAVRYADRQGRTAYYTPDGQALRKSFTRTPVDFARITSGFSMRRLHPILNKIRAHKGVDYAAAKGTPVKATGDGRVEFMGRRGGYGNVIVLKHGASYETVYAHLSRYRKDLRVGGAVKQGQVIGYVGTTGLATASHLHYEFRVNGIHKNPMTVALPRATPIPRQYLVQFRGETAPLLAQLDALTDTRYAGIK